MPNRVVEEPNNQDWRRRCADALDAVNLSDLPDEQLAQLTLLLETFVVSELRTRRSLRGVERCTGLRIVR